MERDYWRAVAAYLASCHAATAEYDGMLSGTSNARKKRYASICQKAAQMMTPGAYIANNSTNPKAAEERCLKAMKDLGFTG